MPHSNDTCTCGSGHSYGEYCGKKTEKKIPTSGSLCPCGSGEKFEECCGRKK